MTRAVEQVALCNNVSGHFPIWYILNSELLENWLNLEQHVAGRTLLYTRLQHPILIAKKF